jgi:hypothetical protein
MKNKALWLLAQMAVVALALSAGSAQNLSPSKLSGTIDDYTPTTTGPWEIHGTWSLKVKGDSGTADFTAALDMEHSDIAVLAGAARNAHTHHIVLVDGAVTPLPNGGGIRITGPATITGNGNFPPPFGPNSTVQIDITGGNAVQFSNIRLTLTGDAATHFGSQAINGVVGSTN